MKQWLMGMAAIVLLSAGNCGNGGNGFTHSDASIQPPALTWQDIGTVCTYDPTRPSDNPTNTCARTGLICVIASSDGLYSNFGSLLYEAIPLYTRFLADQDEGICTLVSGPGAAPPACPVGTFVVPLSSGYQICMRGCEITADCGREGYVCDYRLMNGGTYNPNTGAVSPVAVPMCVPACYTDMPYCLRSFIYQGNLVVYDTDLFGGRECDTSNGLCVDVVTREGRYVGDRCSHSSQCSAGDICISGALYGAPDDHGFCAHYCDPTGQNTALKCQLGQSCEFFLSVGYCFPDCVSNLCAGDGQQCAKADENKAGLTQAWANPHCIQCELSSLICAGSDAGVAADAAVADAAHDAGAGG